MTSPATTVQLQSEILDGLRVFNTVDKLNIPEELLLARARNIAMGIVGNYRVTPLPALPAAPNWDTALIDPGERPRGNWVMGPVEQTEPFRHMYGCRCGQCPGEFPAKSVGHSWSCRCDKCDLVTRSVRR